MLYINNAILRKKPSVLIEKEAFIFNVKHNGSLSIQFSSECYIDWGDDGDITHIPPNAGVGSRAYSLSGPEIVTIKIYPVNNSSIDIEFPSNVKSKIKRIIQWGHIKLWGDSVNGESLFSNTNGFDSNELILDKPIFISEDLSYLFNNSTFNQKIGNWDVSSATNMESMFEDNQEFNEDISEWCVENIPTKPLNFDYNTDPNWTEQMKPKWGDPC